MVITADMTQTATMPICHMQRWRFDAFLRMPRFNMSLWRCGILTSKAVAGIRLRTQNLEVGMSACLPDRRNALKNASPHPPVVAFCLRLGRRGQIYARARRGLLIRLLEVSRNQISKSFQVARINDNLQSLIWVPYEAHRHRPSCMACSEAWHF